MASSNDFQQFDWALYGMVIRKRRLELGYKKAEHFARSVWRRTRFDISRDSLYKIEQGKQVPTGMQVLALNMSLFGSPFPEELFEICASRTWKKIARDVRAASVENGSDYEAVDMTQFVPGQWKKENFNQGLLDEGYVELMDDHDENGEVFSVPVDIMPRPTVRELAYSLNDKNSLFSD